MPQVASGPSIAFVASGKCAAGLDSGCPLHASSMRACPASPPIILGGLPRVCQNTCAIAW